MSGSWWRKQPAKAGTGQPAAGKSEEKHSCRSRLPFFPQTKYGRCVGAIRNTAAPGIAPQRARERAPRERGGSRCQGSGRSPGRGRRQVPALAHAGSIPLHGCPDLPPQNLHPTWVHYFPKAAVQQRLYVGNMNTCLFLFFFSYIASNFALASI